MFLLIAASNLKEYWRLLIERAGKRYCWGIVIQGPASPSNV